MKDKQLRKGLIIVDLQKDFIPGGALAVQQGNAIIPYVNQLIKQPFDSKVATKDWHPKNHISFRELWPVHCVQNTAGAEFAEGWNVGQVDKIFYKGTDSEVDSYSAFFDNDHKSSTGLADYLKEREITDLYLAGLATDYCVKYSALDAQALGFNTYVIMDACRGVNLKPNDTEEAIQAMKQAGVMMVTFAEVMNLFKRG